MRGLMIRLALAISLVVLVISGPAAAAGPTATAAKNCKLTISQQRNAGATYLVSLSATGVSCATALKVEKAWQACRKKTSGHRVCKSRVLGYKSTQKVLDSSKTQYDAKVTATYGSRKVVFIYTLNT